jgi:predicted transcriptional regulator
MTTITIDPNVKDLLDGLKLHPKETYNEVVKRLATNAYDWEPLSEEDIQDIEEGLRDYANGKFYTLEEIEEEIRKENEEACMP